MEEFTGRCMCGALRFAATAPSLFCAHCHCRFCRQAHGAAFVTWVGFPQASVRIVADGDALHWYQSSKWSRRGSCSRCGTMMFYESTAAPGETHVTRASIIGPVDRKPELHSFFDQKVDWVTINDDLPKLRGDDPILSSFKEIGR
ncbi:MAG TPA: GFA family protein [Candidatus Binataceae bacterium]|nr:GFA family protein [Candidatus Binataceae bacterium]